MVDSSKICKYLLKNRRHVKFIVKLRVNWGTVFNFKSSDRDT